MTFLRNHRDGIAAMDFFVVPTAAFRVLYVFFVIHHGRRRVAHIAVTENPKKPNAIVVNGFDETARDWVLNFVENTASSVSRKRLDRAAAPGGLPVRRGSPSPDLRQGR
jgi:hypothetical protein